MAEGEAPPEASRHPRHVPRKRFGQHFLHDPYVLQRIVSAIDPRAGEHVVEIGPGEGALTRPLLERLPRLTVVEIDRDLAARLQQEFPAERLEVHLADALEFDFGALPAPLRLVGNLPYNVSTPLLFHLATYADRVRDMHFMLQREVVDRMAAEASTPEYGRLSVMLQRRFRIHSLFRVAPGAFRPPPKVESAVVRLEPLPPEQIAPVDEAVFARVVMRAFAARRKTLRNGLAGLIDEAGLRAAGIDPGLRPENITPGEYIKIAMSIGSKSAPEADLDR
jgi:16S rRNA (adenine1518-N6/adenine1519-N6)-dimethyltransferase